jgi:hypothetical protein
MTIHFITFGSGYWKASVELLCNEISETGLFDKIHGLDETFLGDFEKEFIEQNPRGYGYWIWKAYICQKIMAEADENDIFVYADAGCVVNTSGLSRMKEYFSMVKDSPYGIIGFQMTNAHGCHLERLWNKMELVRYFKCENNSAILDSGQIEATAFVWRKCNHTKNIFNMWNNIPSIDKLFINDVITVEQDKLFKEHRRDQSLFSLLLKTQGAIVLGWETWCWSDPGDFKNFPLLERRRGKR